MLNSFMKSWKYVSNSCALILILPSCSLQKPQTKLSFVPMPMANKEFGERTVVSANPLHLSRRKTDIATLDVSWPKQQFVCWQACILRGQEEKSLEPVRLNQVGHWDDGHHSFLSASIATCTAKGPWRASRCSRKKIMKHKIGSWLSEKSSSLWACQSVNGSFTF